MNATLDSSSVENRPPVAVVTGGSQGLGLELVRRLVADGWTVVTDARRGDRLADGIDSLDLAPGAGRVVALLGDVTDPAHRAELAREAADEGTVALVVNNASTLGASPLPAVDDLDAGVLERVFAVNVVAPAALYRALLPHLAPGAVVVNVSSDAGAEAYPTWGAYGSSKAALDHLSAVLAVERPDLLVYAVDPGDMRTEMHQAAFPGDDISDRPLPETSAAAIVALVSSGRPSGRYLASEVTT